MTDVIGIKGRKINAGIIFSVILVLQIVAFTYLCIQKKDYHIDEIYSYILSNSYDTNSISNSADVNGQWISGDSFLEFVTVQNGERFAYQKTYFNNTTDAHPPLFYFVLHTICSLFPDSFSKWFGFAENIMCFIAAQIFLYLLSGRLLGSRLWGVLSPALYGALAVCADTVLFFRMYMMLTMFSIILLWLHWLMLNDNIRHIYVYLYIITFLGTFTHYYFAVFAFFTAACYCVYLIRIKQVKRFFAYSAAMTSAIATVFAVYPAAFTQITGSETNNIGNEVSTHILDFSGLAHSVSVIIKSFCYSVLTTLHDRKTLIVLAAIFVLTIGASIVKREKTKTSGTSYSGRYMIILLIIMLLTITAVSHFSGKYATLRYIYHVIPVGVLAAVCFLKLVSDQLSLNSAVMCMGTIVFSLAGTFSVSVNQQCSYLFPEDADIHKEVIDTCKNTPVIVLGNGKTYFATANYMVFSKLDRLYISDNDNIDIDELLKSVDISNGVTFIILTDQVWSEGYDGDETMKKVLSRSNALSEYTEVGISNYSTVYFAD